MYSSSATPPGACEHSTELGTSCLEVLSLAVGLQRVGRGVLLHEDILGGRAFGLVKLVGETARLVRLDLGHQVLGDLIQLRIEGGKVIVAKGEQRTEKPARHGAIAAAAWRDIKAVNAEP